MRKKKDSNRKFYGIIGQKVLRSRKTRYCICAGFKSDAHRFIAYFQSYTNTYGDPKRLKELYLSAITRDDIAALSLGTRPDCLDEGIMEMLLDLNKIKPVWIELGLQTVHEKTARAINRGYDLKVFEETYEKLRKAGLTVIVHVILGLPGESREDMLAAECVALLPEDTVLHRMTGDGPRRLLIAPLWSLDKKRVLNTLNRYISAAYDKTSSRTGERLTSIEKFGIVCYNSQLQVRRRV